jgi:HPt (histidine-containing phosphotransfer) domain-containing protein
LQAHKIKGAAAVVAAESLHAVALAIEQEGAAGNLDKCRDLLPRVAEELERFESTLKRAGWIGIQVMTLGSGDGTTNHD